MAFSLSKVVNGERITFSDKLILEILGDVINDEISIDGKAYRISSFIITLNGCIERLTPSRIALEWFPVLSGTETNPINSHHKCVANQIGSTVIWVSLYSLKRLNKNPTDPRRYWLSGQYCQHWLLFWIRPHCVRQPVSGFP